MKSKFLSICDNYFFTYRLVGQNFVLQVSYFVLYKTLETFYPPLMFINDQYKYYENISEMYNPITQQKQ